MSTVWHRIWDLHGKINQCNKVFDFNTVHTFNWLFLGLMSVWQLETTLTPSL